MEKGIMENGIKQVRKVGPIKVERIEASEFQKENSLTAMLVQEIETISSYPSKRVSNSLKGNIFSSEDFGYESQDFTNIEKRVAFILVPENTTVESLEEVLAKHPDACLYRTLSNEPILDEGQKYMIQTGQRTLDFFADSQAVRDSETGELILDKNGNVQYRRVEFWPEKREDVDLRTTDKNRIFVSENIMAELEGASVMYNQKITN